MLSLRYNISFLKIPTGVDSLHQAVTTLGHKRNDEFSETGPIFLNYVQ